MKKFAVIIVVIVIMAGLLAGCSSQEQRAADAFVDKLETILDEAEAAIEVDDMDKLSEIYDDLLVMYDQYQTVYDNLLEVDKSAAEDFATEVKRLSNEFISKMESLE